MEKSAKSKSTKYKGKPRRASKKVSKNSSKAKGSTKTTTKVSGGKRIGTMTVTAGRTSTARTGRRIGTKKSDLRFEAPDGSQWASPFEYRVYSELLSAGLAVRKCDVSDQLGYSTPVKNGVCEACGHTQVAQQRTYTPDLKIPHADQLHGPYVYFETKGYFPGRKRSLFRAVLASNPYVDIRLIAQANHWVTKGKTRLSDWAKRFKIPFHVWNGALPENWL